jgi:thiosulfate dehydrogenase [quinone] large subunit
VNFPPKLTNPLKFVLLKKMKFDGLALTYAFWCLRLWLGLRILFAGLEKFSGKITVQQPLLDASGAPDSSGAVVEVTKKVYGFAHYQAIPESLQDRFANEPLLPGFLATPFYFLLGYILIALGLALLLGIRTREALLGIGAIFTMLTIGLILIGQEQGVAWLGVHVLLVVAALVLLPYNRWSLTRS